MIIGTKIPDKLSMLAPYFAMAVMLGGASLMALENRAGLGEQELRRVKVVEKFRAFPTKLGVEALWLLVDEVEIPTRQVSMLELTAYVSRSYARVGVSPPVRATVFIANSGDARAMAGHHPPNCYPASGWTPAHAGRGNVRRFGSPLGLPLPTALYRFERGSNPRLVRWVANGFLMPGGKAVATLAETAEVSARASTSRLGLTQFQIVIDGERDVDEVENYVAEIIGALPADLLDAVMAPRSRGDVGPDGGDS